MTTSLASLPSVRASEPTARVDVALLLERVALASVFLFHGGQKLFGSFGGTGLSDFAAYLDSLGVPLAMFAAFLAASSELVGGLALATGRGFLALVPLVATMFVATLTHLPNGYDVVAGGAEYPLTLTVLLVGLLLSGPGKLLVRWGATPGGAA